ncbi:MAG: hypothetical protein OEL53_06250 [Rhodospirillales bacterium]|nr:hypothetical protein [Rhodospirillales bacterium]
MMKRLHPVAGAIAMLLIASFWLSTVVSEVMADPETVACVKRAILWALPVLILSLILTGASGFRQASKALLVQQKLRRMKIVAANGILVLLPSAILLDHLAAGGHFTRMFYTVQGLELAAGGVNLTLMVMNAQDGLRLSGRITG